MKKQIALTTLFFCVAVTLFFGLVYPHHLHYQEQYQLFLFDCTYIYDIVRLPGGVADLLGRFCTQFFLYAWVGAVIIGLLLSAVQLLTLRLARLGNLYALSFIPPCLLWIFMLDENALLGGVWAVLLTLLVAWGIDKLADGLLRRIMIVVAVPVLYWIAGPVSILFFMLQPLRTKPKTWLLGALVLLMPILLSNFLPVPSGSLWFGVHFYRYPTEIPTMLWIAVLSVVVLALISRFFSGLVNKSSNKIVPLVTFLLVIAGMGSMVWKNCNLKAEKTMQYDFMACHQQWNRILDLIKEEKPNNQIGVTVQNLALAMRGILAENMLEYNQNGTAGLLPDVQRDATSPMPTAEAFYQLGMINVAQRTVFEAQEAILDFQKSGRCYKRLAQTNLINGNYEVARKYLVALQKTLFYSDWADETMKLLGDDKAIANHPEYGHLRKSKYDEDFYFSDRTSSDMLQGLLRVNKNNHLAYDYLMAYYMLTGDAESFANQIINGENPKDSKWQYYLRNPKQ